MSAVSILRLGRLRRFLFLFFSRGIDKTWWMDSSSSGGLLPIADAPGVRGSRKRVRDEDGEDVEGIKDLENQVNDADEDEWPATRRRPIDWTESDPFIQGVWAVSNRNRVRDMYGRIREACTDSQGYRILTIAGKCWRHHRLVYFGWYGVRPDGQIDHRNGNRGDNRPENLEDVTPAENMRRTWENPNRRTSSGNWSRSVIGTLGNGELREFTSATAAANELKLDCSHIIACCRGRHPTAGGWAFKYQEQPDLEGEVWEPIQGIRVSNCGRLLRPKTGKHYPQPLVNGYCMIGIKHRSFQFHRLVCQAFHGEPPPGYQADHKDSNPRNNRADNLQWLSPADNNAKKRHVLERSTRREITTSIGGRYESVAHAAAAIGVHEGHVVNLCNSGKAHSKHGVVAYLHVLPKEGEIFKNITEADLLKLGRESARAHTKMK